MFKRQVALIGPNAGRRGRPSLLLASRFGLAFAWVLAGCTGHCVGGTGVGGTGVGGTGVGGTGVGGTGIGGTGAFSLARPVAVAQETQTDTGVTANADKNVNEQDISERIEEFQQALGSRYFSVRMEAIQALGQLKIDVGSDEAQQVVKILLKVRQQEFNDYEDSFVDAALQDLGDVSVAEAKRLVKLDQAENLQAAAEIMRAVGGTKFDALRPELESFLEGDNYDRRWLAMFVIEAVGPPAAVSIDKITPYLASDVVETETENFQLQVIALRALAGIGPAASGTRQQVEPLIDGDDNLSVRSHALLTLGKITAGQGEVAAAAAETLSGQLNKFHFMLKSRALEGIIALGSDAAGIAGKLKPLMQDKTGLSAQAALAYGQASGDWETAIARLVELVPDANVGFEALQYLGEAGPRARLATADLLTFSESTDEDVRWAAMQALSRLLPKIAAGNRVDVANAGTTDGTLDSAAPLSALSEADQATLRLLVPRFKKVAQGGSDETSFFAQQTLKRWAAAGWITGPEAKDGDR